MTTNFDFLKRSDKELFKIINDAEELYRSEFFEQCMTQTRRFGEVVCKNVLGSRRTTEVSFDAMLSTLKDCTLGSSEEAKEFVEDLYFLKKHGNEATHSITVKQDGMEALECLQRAFEIAINYCVYSCNEDRRILKLQYDIDLLVTGKKSRKKLSDRYTEAKEKTAKKSTSKTTKPKPQYCSVKSQPQKAKKSFFWYFVGISAIISAFLLLLLAVI
jgi:hypothetical protein